MRRTTVSRLSLVGALLLAGMLLSACGSSDEGGNGGATTTTVTAGLEEFAISTDPASVPAGSVTFKVTNNGPDDVHEFVVIRTDLGATELPTDADGAVDESGEGMEAVDELEDIAVGQTQSLTVDLAAGSYVIICNILQKEPDGSLEAHYTQGMRTGFTVE